jgi:hypothetical protein
MEPTTLDRGVDAINGASFAAMQWRLIEHAAQIREAGQRHHDCCRSMAEVFEHDHADALKLNESHVARAIVELLGDTEPFPKAESADRCPCCLEPSGHPEGCPFHPASLEAARVRVLGLRAGDITDETINAAPNLIGARHA